MTSTPDVHLPLDLSTNLPDEILSTIFHHLIELPPYTAERSLPPILLVCHRWNAIAISTPDLWTTITITSGSSPRIRDLFPRSKDVDVDVIIGDDLDSDEDISGVTELIPRHLHRIRNLCLVATPPHLVPRILDHLITSAPRLELLAILYPDLLTNAQRSIIPPSFLSEGTPRIKHLLLESFSLPWTSPLFHNLTTLSIVLENAKVAPTSDLFLSVLENCPSLEQFLLNGAGPILPLDSQPGTKSPRRVHLPNLQFLTLHLSTLNQTIYTLSHMFAPSTSVTTIIAEAPDGWDVKTHFTSFINEICVALETSSSQVDWISFSPTDYEETHLYLTIIFLFSTDARLDLRITNASPTELFKGFTEVQRGVCGLPSRLIVQMSGGKGTLGVEDWRLVLGGWEGLEMLILLDGDEECLVTALGTDKNPDDASGEEKEGVICPGLEFLGLNRSRPADDPIPILPPTIVSSLVKCLTYRESKGYRLEKLSFQNVCVGKGDQEILEELVEGLAMANELVMTEKTRFGQYPLVVQEALRSYTR
ncbi:hypothetical protein JAAARDRAFT_59661 [Jaapia argillacea MUCL 33604]|uniref:F-box domain-containing protein n=1 Tax=Jaapia argillacea MUCL 33604 TaxID=933084 RepID=A0A067PLA7_9AGAM|nr:hypothetical protein JAAARDRAFT_59661 [Jaapia argillacea MUCL 33604]